MSAAETLADLPSECPCAVCTGRGLDPDLPWEDDPDAQEVVDRHPDGLPLEAVGAALGVSRERARQIEQLALARLLGALRAELGPDVRRTDVVDDREATFWETMISWGD